MPSCYKSTNHYTINKSHKKLQRHSKLVGFSLAPTLCNSIFRFLSPLSFARRFPFWHVNYTPFVIFEIHQGSQFVCNIFHNLLYPLFNLSNNNCYHNLMWYYKMQNFWIAFFLLILGTYDTVEFFERKYMLCPCLFLRHKQSTYWISTFSLFDRGGWIVKEI